MAQRSSVRAALAALTLTFILGACVSPPAGGGEPSIPSRPASTPVDTPMVVIPSPMPTAYPATPTPTLTPSPTPRPTEDADVAIVDHLWEWTVIMGPSEDTMPSYDFDGQVLIWQEFGDQIEGERWNLRLMARTREETWEVHQTVLGWGFNDTFVADGRIVFVEFEHGYGYYNLWAYDVGSREHTLLEEWAGEPYQHQVPLLSLDGRWLAWSTTLRDGRSCIRVRDLEEGTQFDAICSADDLTVLDWPYLRWPVLTYQEARAGNPEWTVSYRTIYTLRLPDGEPRPHEGHKGIGFQGAADESVVVWTEMKSGEINPWSVPVYGEGPDGQVVRLGAGSAGSVAVCAGRAYWKIEFGNRPIEIRSWVPGGPVEVIYRSPDDEECLGHSDYATTKPLCHGDLIMIARSGWQAGSPEEVLVARVP